MIDLTLLKQQFTRKLFIGAILVALLYVVASVYAVNRTIILTTITGAFPLSYKINLLANLFINSWAMYQPIEAVLLACIAVLMGLNVALMAKLFGSLRGKSGLRMSFGGSTFFAIVSAGCPTCGVSVLSLVGVSSPLLPFQGIPLQLFSLVLLSGSIAYTLFKLTKPAACTLQTTS
jgi:hypothetical protein